MHMEVINFVRAMRVKLVIITNKTCFTFKIFLFLNGTLILFKLVC